MMPAAALASRWPIAADEIDAGELIKTRSISFPARRLRAGKMCAAWRGSNASAGRRPGSLGAAAMLSIADYDADRARFSRRDVIGDGGVALLMLINAARRGARWPASYFSIGRRFRLDFIASRCASTGAAGIHDGDFAGITRSFSPRLFAAEAPS